MTFEERLERYLKFNNLKLEEIRIAGKGNSFRILHCFPGSRRIRCMGDFMLHDEDCARMGEATTENVAEYLLKHTREIVEEIRDKDYDRNHDMMLRPVLNGP